MNIHLVQFGLVATVAAMFIVVVVRLARRQRISFQYAVGWLTLLSLALLSGLLVPLVEPLARTVRLSAVAVLLAVSISILLAVCIQLSISISGLHRQIRRIHEELAIVRAQNESQNDEI
jgi:hypothetical protein